MWHWQLKKEHKKYLFWAKLSGLSCAFHMGVLFALFFMYRGVFHHVACTVHARNLSSVASIVFAPSVAVAKPGVQQIVKQTIVAPVPKIKPKTVMASKPPVKKVAPKKAPIKKAPVVKKVIQKVVPKKPTPVAKSTPKKEVAQAVKPTQPVVPAKKVEPKKEAPSPEPLGDAISTAQEASGLTNDPHAKMAAKNYRELHAALARHWHPPSGIDPACSCQMAVIVNWSGKVDQFELAQSSGVLMFDIAARTALLAMEMPRWTWGKSLTITFNQ